MDMSKRKALEAAGWKFGDAADFLEMDEDERRMLDARMRIAKAVLRQLPERSDRDPSLDQVLQAFMAAGGKVVVGSKAPAKRRSAKGATLMLKVTITEARPRVKANRARVRRSTKSVAVEA